MQIKTWTILIYIFTQITQAQVKCENLFKSSPAPLSESTTSMTENIQISDSQRKLMFESTIRSIKNLKPSDLLPQEFINDLTKKFGPLKVYTFGNDKPNFISQFSGGKLNLSEYDNELHVRLYAGDESLMNLSLYFNKKSNYLTIDGLELLNPLNNKDQNLHMQQSKKGLPSEVFNFAKNALIRQIKNNGWRGLICKGTTHYLVSMVYQRLIKMTPTEKSEKYYSYLADIRKSFESSDIFYTALGSIKIDYSMLQIQQLWQRTDESRLKEKRVYPDYL